MAICHTILVQTKTTYDELDPEKKDGNGETFYSAQSPDELALVNAAKTFGIVFKSRPSAKQIEIVDESTAKSEVYDILNILEFTSARKRMSVIIRCPNVQIKLLCKPSSVWLKSWSFLV